MRADGWISELTTVHCYWDDADSKDDSRQFIGLSIQPVRHQQSHRLWFPKLKESVQCVSYLSVLEMLHVSSSWYFSAQHAASVSMLLSICFWLTACLCELSKSCWVSLNKLMRMGVFYIPSSPPPLQPSPPFFCISLVFSKKLYTVGPWFQGQRLNADY